MREHLETTMPIAGALDRIGVRRDAVILLALSGGADSVALFHVLVALRERFGYRLAAAHFNHHLRGDESDRDQAFVCDLCARAQIELVVGHAEDLGGCNLEERARESRYRFLHSAADRMGAGHIALAHHADDQAETVLMRLLRGTGVAGLGAMAEASGRLIRPMLSLGRGEIIDYLNAIGARFVTDSTNCSPAILRNRLRAELIPMLERDYAPQFGRRLGELADEMRSLDDFVSAAAEAELDRSPGAGGRDSRSISRASRRSIPRSPRPLFGPWSGAKPELCAGSRALTSRRCAGCVSTVRQMVLLTYRRDGAPSGNTAGCSFATVRRPSRRSS